MISVLFRVPCPTPDGRTAEDLCEKRVRWISAEMQADARGRTRRGSDYLEGDIGLVTEAGV